MINGDILALDVAPRCMGVCRGRPASIPDVRSRAFTGLASTMEAEHNLTFAQMTNWVAEEFDPDVRPLPKLVAIEAPIPTGGGQKTNFATQILLLGLQGIVRGEATRWRVPVRLVPVGTWRKYVIGKGNMPGPRAKDACFRLCRDIGIPVKNTDESDAAGVWLWACGVLGGCRDDRLLPLALAAFKRSGSNARP